MRVAELEQLVHLLAREELLVAVARLVLAVE